MKTKRQSLGRGIECRNLTPVLGTKDLSLLCCKCNPVLPETPQFNYLQESKVVLFTSGLYPSVGV